ncbi:MAG: helix-turn-helix transcriptional regulator [Candidatus Woesearchaeota archaeon]
MKKNKTNKLRGRRNELRLTQKDMAHTLGIALSAYNEKENEKREFSEREINVIMRKLDCEYNDIFLDRKYAQ